MVVDLMKGINDLLKNSTDPSAVYLRKQLAWYGWSDTAPSFSDSQILRYPYLAYNLVTTGSENYVMGDYEAVYQVIEIQFKIVTGTNAQPDRSPRRAGILAKNLKKLLRRGNFALDNGRVLDAVVMEDFPQQSTDSDGYEWFIGIQFEIGT